MRRWALWLFIFTLAIRLITLGRESVWYDEAFTYQVASLPLPRLMAATAGDVHPPLWYLIEWLTVHVIGGSEFAIRLPAALFGAATASEVYQLIKRFTDHKAALAAAVLVGIMPGQLYYGQEARMYTLLSWLTMFSTRAALDKNYWRLGPSLGLMLWTHNMAPLYVGIIGILALIQNWRSALKSGGFAGAMWLPWLGTLAGQVADINNGFWIPPSGIGGALYYLHFGTFYDRLPGFAQGHAVIAAVGFTLVALYVLRSDLRKLWPLIALGFGPALLLYIASAVWRPVMLTRALIPAAAVVLCLWGMAFVRLGKWERYAALALFVPLLLLSLGGYWLDPMTQKFDAEGYSGWIKERWKPGDAVYNINLASAITFQYYMPPEQYPAYLLPHAGDLAQSLSDPTKTAMGLKQQEAPISELERRGYRRVWLLYVETPVISDDEIAAAKSILGTYPVVSKRDVLDSALAHFAIYVVALQ